VWNRYRPVARFALNAVSCIPQFADLTEKAEAWLGDATVIPACFKIRSVGSIITVVVAARLWLVTASCDP